ncbi:MULTISPECIES: tRNA (guanosine(46)-N7)-methyltransferase TrmB [unclassified Oleiphilus]|uniref:tRNA (guanosine(46)-N7)-methyltransferase TrmB n=2 Tax=Oleiphilus TaxID=141450 RepID=UPI000A4F5980
MTDQDNPMQRVIRSFVVRSGRMTAGQTRGWDSYWEAFGLDPEQELNFEEIFGNTNPVVFEIGFGMGSSLFEMAKADPNTNFVGVEVHRPGVGALLAQAGDEGLTNLRLLCCDAVELLKNKVPNNSLVRLQLYFPDPWHKKRHHKRRIVQPEFAALVATKLSEGGVFHMATDWEPYAEHMAEVMDAAPDYSNCAETGSYSPKPDYRPTTKFEKRGERLGHGVWDLLYRKSV